MWPFSKSKRTTVEERAALAAAFLLDSLEGVTGGVMLGAVGKEWERTSRDVFRPTAHEVMIFQLHLADRLTRVKARGKNGGLILMGALLPIIAEQVQDGSRQNFHNLYSARSLFYSECRDFTSKEGEPAGGTLFWEFAKIALAVTKQDPEITKMLGVTAMCGDILRGIDRGFEELEVYG
ncbi:hypothetical protein [Dyella choica]|uniref:Uncharacterized protein n=1 Tax=Dyella choica TaxID=1927959 RepID=A0A432MBD5_9GAMM|nr:hypothetical protein [Dyella choica]RUL78950.1 hypothetical protein EKH80_03890 [Dyella choica]